MCTSPAKERVPHFLPCRFPELWYSWRHQLAEFQEDYHVAAFDMRGYGASEKPQVQMMAHFACYWTAC
jgi:pimeloyl-ACP methyl ester carboxylesterase